MKQMNHALQVLEWGAIRAQLAEECESPLGRARASELEPSYDGGIIADLLTITAEADRLSESGLPGLRGLHDVIKDVRLTTKGAVLEASNLAKVGSSLRTLTHARIAISGSQIQIPRLRAEAEKIADFHGLGERLEISVAIDGEVLDSASTALASARNNIARVSKRLLDKIQSYTTGSSRSYLSDTVYTQRNGRYVIPLKAEHRGKIRGIVHDTSASGQTIFLEPEPVVELGNQLREAEAAEKKEIVRILAELSGLIGQIGDEIIRSLQVGARLDLVFAKVRLGHRTNGVVPELEAGHGIHIESGRHPLIGSGAVPLTVHLGLGRPSILITGPNTGGKTIAIKTVGLFAAMAQSGMMVPAHRVRFGYFSQFWADIGDEQSLEQSLSTFSGHVKNIADALRDLKPGALVLLDEVGAGTDPDEGAALAAALIDEFLSRNAVVMASTHYGELKIFAGNHPQLTNASMEFDLKSLRPTYRFLEGTPGSSHAFKIAARYGIPGEVIERAEAGFSEQDRNVSRMIEQLESAQKRAQRAQSEADRLSARLRKVEEEAQRKIDQAEAARKRVGERASSELDELLRQIRIEAEEVFKEVKQGGTQEAIDTARNKLRNLQDAAGGLSRELKPKEKSAIPTGEIPVGAKVKIRSLGMTGIVQGSKGKKLRIQAGALNMDVDRSDVSLIETPDLTQSASKVSRTKSSTSRMRLEKVRTMNPEIHLRQLRAEDAEAVLDKFIDDAVTAGLESVRIVHGKGEGVLRTVTHNLLRRHSQVASFQYADAESGGQGATVAKLK